MPELRLSGLSTGIDTQAIVQQLMEVNRRRLSMYEQDLQEDQAKKDAISELESKLSDFKTKTRKLSDASQLKAFDAKSSDTESLTVEANADAIEGSHTVKISQLATSERWVHDGFKYESSLVGTGDLILKYNSRELIVSTNSSTTLDDLVGLINNDPDNPGIDASILKYDNGNDGVYHLVVSGQDSGGDYQIELTQYNSEIHKSDDTLLTSGDNADADTKITELDDFDETIGVQSGDVITIAGTTHDGSGINGGTGSYDMSVSSYTTIQDIIDEINVAYEGEATAYYEDGQIVLMDNTDGTSSMSMSLTYVPFGGGSNPWTMPTISQFSQGGDTENTNANLAPSTFLETQDAQNSLIKVNDYPPATAEVQTLETTVASTGGTFTLTYQGQTTAAIAYDASAATIQSALEALSTVGTGDITVSGDAVDAVDSMTFTFREYAGDVGMISIDTSGLTGGTHAITETTQGNQGGWISRSTNTVDDVITGVTLKLHAVTFDQNDSSTYDDTVEVNLTRETETLRNNVQAMVESYNEIVKFLDENANYNAETKTTGLLYGEYSITLSEQILRNVLGSVATGFSSDDSFLTPSDLGLTIDTSGLLEFSRKEFDEALNEDYGGVLELLGAQKTGTSSNRAAIKFYGASERITVAGQYEVQITGDGSNITTAQIRAVGETTWRDMDIDGLYVTGKMDRDSNNQYIYDEAALQLEMVSVPNGTETATISVKQGFAGELEEELKNMLDTYKGRIPIAKNSLDSSIEAMKDRIEDEQERLERVEERLVAQYARLEKTLSLLQQQFAGIG